MQPSRKLKRPHWTRRQSIHHQTPCTPPPDTRHAAARLPRYICRCTAQGCHFARLTRYMCRCTAQGCTLHVCQLQEMCSLSKHLVCSRSFSCSPSMHLRGSWCGCSIWPLRRRYLGLLACAIVTGLADRAGCCSFQCSMMGLLEQTRCLVK